MMPLVALSFFSYQQSKSSLEAVGKENLKNSVEITHEMIKMLHKEVETGRLPLAEAQETVKVAILGEKTAEGKRPLNENIHLGDNGYIFVINQVGIHLPIPLMKE